MAPKAKKGGTTNAPSSFQGGGHFVFHLEEVHRD